MGVGLLCNLMNGAIQETKMTTPISIHLFCWICDKSVDVAKCNIDEYGEVVHEACYSARIALEKQCSQSWGLTSPCA
jgi:hypothetical protein